MDSSLLLSSLQYKHICETLSSKDGDSLQDNGNNPRLHVNLKSYLVSEGFYTDLVTKFYCISHNAETQKGWNH
jgi:hypothetical protein